MSRRDCGFILGILVAVIGISYASCRLWSAVHRILHKGQPVQPEPHECPSLLEQTGHVRKSNYWLCTQEVCPVCNVVKD